MASVNVTIEETEYEDPYFSGGNKAFLDRGIAALNAGKGVEHELIED